VSGQGNSVLGKDAMSLATGCFSSVAIGTTALQKNTNGTGNIAIGASAMLGAAGANGGSNVVVGYQAMGSSAWSSGSSNVVVGAGAGVNITTGGNNTLIGAQVAHTTLTTGSGNIYVGTNSAIDAATAAESNTLRIGGSGGTAILATGLNTATPAITLVSGQVGTATNDNAAAGRIGEYLSATRLAGSSVALTTGVSTDILALSLTAGDWDVSGNLIYTGAGGVSLISALGWINTASATLPTLPNGGMEAQWVGTPPTTNVTPYLAIASGRISIAATTVIYLSTNCQFSGGTVSSYGFIGARRAR
jgi:hypothetical protein